VICSRNDHPFPSSKEKQSSGNQILRESHEIEVSPSIDYPLHLYLYYLPSCSYPKHLFRLYSSLSVAVAVAEVVEMALVVGDDFDIDFEGLKDREDEVGFCETCCASCDL
jgi:hypothetical protein